ncbi:MAG: SDR family oxidoreductase [Thermoanaerobaculia bacterium]
MILILGASGTVGSEIVRQLPAKGAAFRGAYHDPAKAPAGVDAVAVDLTKGDSVEAALRGVDTLFLLSPSQGELERNVVALAAKAGTKRIVKLSVWGAEDDFSFARIHRPVETAIQASGLAWTFLRPNGFMQNMASYAGPSIRAQSAFYGSTGEARISHVNVRDIAAVAATALTEPGHEGQVYTLSGPEALSYGEVAAKLSAAAGTDIRYVDLTDEQLKGGMTGAGIPAAYADLLLDLNRYYRAGHASAITGDVKRITGREPISFDRYAAENADSFRLATAVTTAP